MKKIFINLLLLIFLVFTLNYLYTEFFPNYYMDKMYVLFKEKNDISKRPNLTFSNIIIGDSYPTTGILSTRINNCYNFSLPGGSAIEAYYILKRIFSERNRVQTVFMTMAPHHMEGYSCEFWEGPVLNRFYNNEEILEIINYSDSLNDFSSVGANPYTSFLMHNLHIEKDLQPKFMKSYLFFNKADNTRMKYKIIQNLGQTYLGTDSCNNKTFNYLPSKFEPKSIYDLYFHKIMSICKEKNVRFIYETMPLKREQFTLTNQNYLKQYISYLRSVQLKYPKHLISDTIIQYNSCFYGDAMHLNKRGASIYTSELINRYFYEANDSPESE